MTWKYLTPLTEGDLAVCKMFASLRTAANRRNNVNRPFSTGFAEHIKNEEEGLIAEYAFCKHFNIFFDGAFGGKDVGHDCILNGKRIDIKAIAEPHKNLITHKHTDKSNVDIYILIYVSGVETAIVGWVHKDDFVRDENLKSIGYGETYFMEQAKLKVWK